MSQTPLELRLNCALTDLPEGIDRRITCPICSSSRKNKSSRTFSMKREGDAILWKCWHCEEHGKYTPKRPALSVVKTRAPVWPLDNSAIRWLASRGISQETAQRYELYSTEFFFNKLQKKTRAVGFPYTDRGQMYAGKLRCLEDKDFACSGAPKSFFGLPQVGDLDRIIIAEGEMDVLALAEAGLDNAISVPSGAPNKIANTYIPGNDKRMECVSLAKDVLEETEAIYLAGDDDRQGSMLMEELARRVGKHKCWRVRWPDGCKDANDTLLKHGKEKVRECIDSAEQFPVAGLYQTNSFYNAVIDLYNDGKGKGHSTGYMDIDDIYTVVPGYLTVVTGVPSSGKSEFIDQLMVNLSDREEWVHAVCSFENEPRYHIVKLAQKRVQKHFFPGNSQRMGMGELQQALGWVNEHFHFLYQADGSMADIDSIIERLRVAVIRYGVKSAVIDPMNYIEQPNDVNETKWVGDVLTKLRLFAQSHDLHIWLIAHPTKMRRNDNGKIIIPKGYDISGSANYFNKTDFGLTVARDEDNVGIVDIHCWKSRHSWAGRQGEGSLIYDTLSTCYVTPKRNPKEPKAWYEQDGY